MANGSKKQSGQKSPAKKVLAWALCAVIAIGAGVGVGYGIWGNKKAPVEGDDCNCSQDVGGDKTDDKNNDGGITLPGGDDDQADGEGVALLKKVLSRAEFAAYGVDPEADSAVVITATVDGTNLTEEQQKVSWSALAWQDDGDSWASGKDVSDYATVQTEGNQATVTCLQAFGEQITLTATSTFKADASATATFEYKEKISFDGYSIDGTDYIEFDSVEMKINEDRDVQVVGSFTHSEAYTIAAEPMSVSMTFHLNTDAYQLDQKYVGRFTEYEVTFTSDAPTATIQNFLDKDEFEKIFRAGYPTTFTESDIETIITTLTGNRVPQYIIDVDIDDEPCEEWQQTFSLDLEEVQSWFDALKSVRVGLSQNTVIF